MLTPASNSNLSIIFIGADHGGFHLKEKLKKWLKEFANEIVDCGAFDLDPTDDYPLFAAKVAQNVVSEKNSLGILLCRSGGGMTIAANKIKGIRAVEVFSEKTAAHAREHNHANVITLGADYLNFDETKIIIKAFINSVPSEDERHLRRIKQIEQLE
ncbi:MAG: Uncharacterized protein XD95_0407 [Microgenomates bacterium 39_7]|nr:MAG: Uncharacterized protein XD95_0407 [Microgenomates bacterium 39_7]